MSEKRFEQVPIPPDSLIMSRCCPRCGLAISVTANDNPAESMKALEKVLESHVRSDTCTQRLREQRAGNLEIALFEVLDPMLRDVGTTPGEITRLHASMCTVARVFAPVLVEYEDQISDLRELAHSTLQDLLKTITERVNRIDSIAAGIPEGVKNLGTRVEGLEMSRAAIAKDLSISKTDVQNLANDIKSLSDAKNEFEAAQSYFKGFVTAIDTRLKEIEARMPKKTEPGELEPEA